MDYVRSQNYSFLFPYGSNNAIENKLIIVKFMIFFFYLTENQFIYGIDIK